MTRDEVIRGLEICLSKEHCEEDCPWHDKCWAGDACPSRPLMMIAYAMIKELLNEEPRVLTLEEALSGDECWIEGRSGACGYGDALLSTDGEYVDFYRPHSIDTLDFYAYGRVWRCWTSRPTDEQRKAVKWDDA